MRIALIDDLADDRALLTAYLRRYFEHPELFEFHGGEDFFEQYRPGAFDLLFLDCYMGELSGMEVARRVRAAGDNCKLIFSTTSRDFAVEGYAVHADGYLVKPYDYQSFSRAMASFDRHAPQPYVTFTVGSTVSNVMLSHILWCDMQGHYACVHQAENETLNVRLTFAELCSQLSPFPQFLVCCRGCLVNLDHVRELTDHDFVLFDGQHVPIRQRDISMMVNAYADYRFRKARGELDANHTISRL